MPGAASPRAQRLDQPAERESRDLAGRELSAMSFRPVAPSAALSAITGAQFGAQLPSCSYFDHHGKDHRPPTGSVIDQLSNLVVDVLLNQLDFTDFVGLKLA